MARVFFELTDETYKRNEKHALELIDKVIPFIKVADVNLYNQYINNVIPDLKGIIYSKRYKNAPMVYKLQMGNVLNKLTREVDEKLHDMLGQDVCDDISLLVRSNRVSFKTINKNLE